MKKQDLEQRTREIEKLFRVEGGLIHGIIPTLFEDGRGKIYQKNSKYHVAMEKIIGDYRKVPVIGLQMAYKKSDAKDEDPSYFVRIGPIVGRYGGMNLSEKGPEEIQVALRFKNRKENLYTFFLDSFAKSLVCSAATDELINPKIKRSVKGWIKNLVDKYSPEEEAKRIKAEKEYQDLFWSARED